MTTQHETEDAARLREVAELLLQEGCTSASIFFNGGEWVVDGCAPSYETKRRLQVLVAELMGQPIRNSLRVYPR